MYTQCKISHYGEEKRLILQECEDRQVFDVLCQDELEH